MHAHEQLHAYPGLAPPGSDRQQPHNAGSAQQTGGNLVDSDWMQQLLGNFHCGRGDGGRASGGEATPGDEPSVARLLSEGASPNGRDGKGWPALVNAAKRGHVAIVEALLKAGADKEARDTKFGATALIHAARWGRAIRVCWRRGVGRGCG